MWTRLFAALALWLLAAPALAAPPVWIVRDADSELVLFGSVHVLPPGLDWRRPEVDAALAGAEDVWFELLPTTDTDAEAARLAAARGMLPPGERLADHLSPQTRARLAAAARRLNLSLELLDRMKPWFAEIALAGAAFRAAGADLGLGVEKQLEGATPPHVQRRAFETPAEQIAIFDETPLAAQVASLEYSLAELEADPRAFETLVRRWLDGDVEGLDRHVLAPLSAGAPDVFRRLVVERNAAWMEVLAARLRGTGRTVVVVGVGHLVGEEGLPARLRALGYSVEGP